MPETLEAMSSSVIVINDADRAAAAAAVHSIACNPRVCDCEAITLSSELREVFDDVDDVVVALPATTSWEVSGDIDGDLSAFMRAIAPYGVARVEVREVSGGDPELHIASNGAYTQIGSVITYPGDDTGLGHRD